MFKKKKRKRHIATRSVIMSQRKRTVRKTISMVFFVLVFLVAVMFVSRHEKLSVHIIDVKDGVLLTESEVMEVLDVWLDRKLFSLVPYSNRFYATPKRLKSLLLEEFGGLEDVVVKITLDGGVLITLQEMDLMLLGCRSTNPFSSERCVMVSEKGKAVASAPYYSNGLITKIYAPDSFFQDEYPYTFLREEYAVGVVDMFEELELLGIESSVGSILNDRDMVFSVNAYSGNKSNLDLFIEIKDIETKSLRGRLLENLSLGIGGSPLGKLLEEKPETLERIDLRFEDQITYKAR